MGRHASALHVQVNGGAKNDLVKQLCHKEVNTALVNYADLFSINAVRSLAGWPKSGIVKHPRHSLREELRSGLYVPLLYAACPFIKTLREQYDRLSAIEKEKKNT